MEMSIELWLVIISLLNCCCLVALLFNKKAINKPKNIKRVVVSDSVDQDIVKSTRVIPLTTEYEYEQSKKFENL
jgi:hypothetical protein